MPKQLSRKKKTSTIVCIGTRTVYVKTLHRKFNFELQRYRQGKNNFPYFELTERLSQGYTTPRLKEYSAYYSNRMSYEEVEQLLQRNQGKKNTE